jgi:hypothetical protein
MAVATAIREVETSRSTEKTTPWLGLGSMTVTAEDRGRLKEAAVYGDRRARGLGGAVQRERRGWG